ncbi:MAG: DUF3795 domain-containing protein [Dehalococcoidales bacterium]|nr:DUF3795 domain-containing protein [Dehalococcoidales bacterium]
MKSLLAEELIAPCGMNCGLCSSYLTLKYDLKKKGIMRSECPGCRPRNKNCAFMKKACKSLANGLYKYCFECESYPCTRLKSLDKRYRMYYHMSMIENLDYIKENGIKKFLRHQTGKWQCSDCGAIICCHNGICYSCSADKLFTLKRRYRWTEDQDKG